MKNIQKVLFASALAWVALHTAACSSMKVKEQAAISKVHNVAVTSFTADLPASRTLAFDIGSGKLGGASGGSLLNQQMPETDQLLEKIIASFSQKMNWKVLSSKQMVASPKYVSTYKKMMEGWHNRMPPSQGINRYTVNGVMDYDSARILDTAGRDQLMADLNVDALVAVWSNTYLNGTTVMGIGSRRPQTSITIMVYAKGVEKPIWIEALTGDEMKDSVGSTGFIDEKLLAQLTLKSADGALKKLGTDVE